MLSSAGGLLDHWTVNSDEYDHVCYSTLVKCISRLRTRDIAAAEKDPRYVRILETARGLIDADPKWMGTRGLANLANSLSKLRQSESRDAVFSALAYAAMMRFEDIERGQHFSNLLHGFASAGVAEQYEDLYVPFGDVIAKRLEQGMEFQPQNLSNIAWAYGHAGVAHTELFDALAREIVPRVSEMKEQHLSNSVLGCAKTGYRNEGLLDAIAEEAAGRPASTSSSFAHPSDVHHKPAMPSIYSLPLSSKTRIPLPLRITIGPVS